MSLMETVSIYVSAQGTQFITGNCSTDAECASACCGFNSGKCSSPFVAQERDGGCGFGNAQPNDDAAKAILGGGSPANNAQAPPVVAATSAAQEVASPTSTAAAGTQFITGECAADGECASKCCGFKTGKCAAPAVAQERDGGCGFGDARPNDNALRALQRRFVQF